MLTKRQATDDDVAFLEEVFAWATRAPITAARGFWDEANERTQFREQLQLHRTQIIENDDMDIGFLSKRGTLAVWTGSENCARGE